MSPTVVCFFLFFGSCAAYYNLGIGVYILNIADIRLDAGSFYADYLLTIYKSSSEQVDFPSSSNSGQRVCTYRPDTFEPFNYTFDDIFIVNKDRYSNFVPIMGTNDTLRGQLRVMGVHYFRPKLREWPFDYQELPIVIDLARQVATQDIEAIVCHMPQFSGVSSSVMFPGGSSHTLDFDFHTFERCWPPFVYPKAKCSGSNFGTSTCDCPFVEINNETLGIPHSTSEDFSCRCKGGQNLASEYQFRVLYDAPEIRGFQRDILPIMFILLVNLISYLIPPEENSLRVSTCSSTLIAAVLFHSGIQSQIPNTGSLSTADVFLLINYGVNLISWVVTLIIVMANSSDLIKKDHVDHIYYTTRIYGPILSIAVAQSFIIYYKDTLWWTLVLSMTIGIILSTGLFFFQSHMINKLTRKKKGTDQPDGRVRSRDKDVYPLVPAVELDESSARM